ncbi:MAG: hypothetical protein F6K00_31620 [Leptolyngbya sp. SIOISBB]|nr:hypothetical protein [Leptolyngbya sp. SIOISBB]
MPKFEYRIHAFRDISQREEELNALGEEEWELVALIPGSGNISDLRLPEVLLKREKKSNSVERLEAVS